MGANLSQISIKHVLYLYTFNDNTTFWLLYNNKCSIVIHNHISSILSLFFGFMGHLWMAWISHPVAIRMAINNTNQLPIFRPSINSPLFSLLTDVASLFLNWIVHWDFNVVQYLFCLVIGRYLMLVDVVD